MRRRDFLKACSAASAMPAWAAQQYAARTRGLQILRSGRVRVDEPARRGRGGGRRGRSRHGGVGRRDRTLGQAAEVQHAPVSATTKAAQRRKKNPIKGN